MILKPTFLKSLEYNYLKGTCVVFYAEDKKDEKEMLSLGFHKMLVGSAIRRRVNARCKWIINGVSDVSFEHKDIPRWNYEQYENWCNQKPEVEAK